MKSPYLDPRMADFYAQASARFQFERPAQDLVKWMNIERGETVLDVGSGTGAVAAAALRAVGSSGMVVGLDSSIEMLKRQQGDSRRAIARAPVLPFMNDTFDVVTAGFVLTHIPDFGAALVQMHRVLKPRGRLGTTVWAGGTTPVSEIWRNAIERFVNIKVIQEEFARIIPWDELLSESAAVEKALERAGFVQIEASTKQYFLSIEHQDFIATKIGSIEGTIVREHLSDEAWNQFLKDLLIRLQREFPDRIEYTREVHFISGQKQ